MTHITHDPDTPGHEQAIINKIIELMQADGFWEGFSYYVIPGYDAATFNPPWVHIFFSENAPSQQSLGRNYKYEGVIRVIIVIPQHEIGSDDRQITKHTEKFDNLLIANKQVKVRADIRTNWLRVQRWRYEYEPESLGLAGIDSTEILVDANYARTVVLS